MFLLQQARLRPVSVDFQHKYAKVIIDLDDINKVCDFTVHVCVCACGEGEVVLCECACGLCACPPARWHYAKTIYKASPVLTP